MSYLVEVGVRIHRLVGDRRNHWEEGAEGRIRHVEDRMQRFHWVVDRKSHLDAWIPDQVLVAIRRT